jgi:hypothetical protein
LASLTLKMETRRPSETSVSVSYSTRHNISEDGQCSPAQLFEPPVARC